MVAVRAEPFLEDRLADLAFQTLLPRQELDPNERDRRERARHSVLDFSTYTMPDYRVNWHHQVLAHYLDLWVKGEVLRLAVSMPPQHGKTELTSRRLPAYIMGRHPNDRLMCCSYSDTMASLINRDVQKIIDSDHYRDLFPGTELWSKAVTHKAQGHYLRNSSMFEVVGRRGSYRSAGVGGGIAGLPFHWGIIDDPFKDYRDANSPAIREAVWNWYTTVFSSRKTEKGARILIVTTRWHQDDLVGRLQELERTNPKADKWTVVCFPAILETEADRLAGDPRQIGEALWEERHPRKELEVERIQTGPIQWSAVYQQKPSPAKGTVFNRDHFRYFSVRRDEQGQLTLYLKTPAGTVEYPAQDCTFYQTCDAADTTGAQSAFTCVTTFVRTPGNDLLVYHVWRKKLEFPKRYAAIQGLRPGLGKWDDVSGKWFLPGSLFPWPRPLAYQAMENKASGIGMIQTAASEGRPFRILKPGTASKTERCASVTVLYEAGKVYHREGADWLGEFERELLSFPSATFSDQVDTLAYGGILHTQDSILGAPARGELIIGPDVVARDQYGNIVHGAASGESAGDRQQVFEVNGHHVVFQEDDEEWHNR